MDEETSALLPGRVSRGIDRDFVEDFEIVCKRAACAVTILTVCLAFISTISFVIYIQPEAPIVNFQVFCRFTVFYLLCNSVDRICVVLNLCNFPPDYYLAGYISLIEGNIYWVLNSAYKTGLSQLFLNMLMSVDLFQGLEVREFSVSNMIDRTGVPTYGVLADATMKVAFFNPSIFYETTVKEVIGLLSFERLIAYGEVRIESFQSPFEFGFSVSSRSKSYQLLAPLDGSATAELN